MHVWNFVFNKVRKNNNSLLKWKASFAQWAPILKWACIRAATTWLCARCKRCDDVPFWHANTCAGCTLSSINKAMQQGVHYVETYARFRLGLFMRKPYIWLVVKIQYVSICTFYLLNVLAARSEHSWPTVCCSKMNRADSCSTEVEPFLILSSLCQWSPAFSVISLKEAETPHLMLCVYTVYLLKAQSTLYFWGQYLTLS